MGNTCCHPKAVNDIQLGQQIGAPVQQVVASPLQRSLVRQAQPIQQVPLQNYVPQAYNQPVYQQQVLSGSRVY